jgi:ankyrin repeat protein
MSKDLDINPLSSIGETPLHLAIRNFRFNMIKYLLYNGASLNIRDSEGITPHDLLSEAQLLYLTEDIGEGYESSTSKSLSKRSKQSDSSNSSSIAPKTR